MPRTKKAEATQVAPAISETAPAITLVAEQAPAGDGGVTAAHQSRNRTSEAVREPQLGASETAAGESAYAADPHAKITVSLSDVRGGPAMHLLRSHRFKQMQIKFEGEQPGEKQIAKLQQTGWTDRNESEGVWTKQIDQAARWQSVQKMELEFRDVANSMREEKGLGGVLAGLGAS